MASGEAASPTCCPPACQVHDLGDDLHTEHESRSRALGIPACLLHIFSFLGDEKDLLRAGAVARQWRALASTDSLWELVYTRRYGVPNAYERLNSAQAQIRRAYALRMLSSPQRISMASSVLCYEPATAQLIVFQDTSSLVFYDNATLGLRTSVHVHPRPGNVASMVAASGGRIVFTADNVLQVWSAETHSMLSVLQGHVALVEALVADEQLLLSSCSVEVRLWSLDTGGCIWVKPHRVPGLADVRLALSCAHSLAFIAESRVAGCIQALAAAGAACGEVVRFEPISVVHNMIARGDQLVAVSRFDGRRAGAGAVFTVLVSVYSLAADWLCSRLVSERVPCSLPRVDVSRLHPLLLAATGDLLLCCVPMRGLSTEGAADTPREPVRGLFALPFSATRGHDDHDNELRGDVLRLTAHGAAAGHGMTDGTTVLVSSDCGRTPWLSLQQAIVGDVSKIIVTPCSIILCPTSPSGSISVCKIPGC